MPPPSPRHSFLTEQGKWYSRYTYLVSLDSASVMLCFPRDYSFWPGQHGLKCSLLSEVFLKIPELSVYFEEACWALPSAFSMSALWATTVFHLYRMGTHYSLAVGPQVVDVHKDFVVWCGSERIPRHGWEGSKRWHQAQQRSRNQCTVYKGKGGDARWFMLLVG